MLTINTNPANIQEGLTSQFGRTRLPLECSQAKTIGAHDAPTSRLSDTPCAGPVVAKGTLASWPKASARNTDIVLAQFLAQNGQVEQLRRTGQVDASETVSSLAAHPLTGKWCLSCSAMAAAGKHTCACSIPGLYKIPSLYTPNQACTHEAKHECTKPSIYTRQQVCMMLYTRYHISLVYAKHPACIHDSMDVYTTKCSMYTRFQLHTRFQLCMHVSKIESTYTPPQVFMVVYT
jgi:hypothetical protein